MVYFLLVMQDVFSVLEWNKVLERLASFSCSELGKKTCLGLKPLEKDKLKQENTRMEESIRCLDLLGRFPIDASSDLSASLTLARKGGELSVEELERICHDIALAKDVKRYFAKALEAPSLKEYLQYLPDCSYLDEAVHKVIAPDLSIYDHASPELHRIRVRILRLEKEMVQQVGYVLEENQEYLSDKTMTLKNGHYVLPVANAYKNKVRGIVQDISGSGETTFIEPAKLVALNNEMVMLRNEEREEIHRLLRELSAKVGGSSESLLEINRTIGYLDFLQAKALYGQSIKGHVASFSNDGSLFLPEARHPLLDPSKVVPNTFSVLPSQKVIIISGPNAGGKTVALKTIGILALMFECALPLPTLEGALLPYFKQIYVDIGDSQSLSDNLSTFSGHMANLAGIVNEVGGNDLVLLDEVGTGTSPREGEALSKAIVLHLLSKHCMALISSHFEGLKAFAFEQKEVENASMLFDEEHLLPTYRIKMGLPGESYGLKVARRFGLKEEIVSAAEQDLLSAQDLSVSKAIARLGAITKETEDLKAELAKEKEATAKKEARLAQKEKELNAREDKYLSSVKAEKERLLDEAKKEIDSVISSLNSPEVKLHQAIQAKKKLEALEEKQAELSFDTEVSLNDYVSVPSFDIVGKVTRIQGKKITLSTRDGLTFETEKGKVVKAHAPEEKKKKTTGIFLDRAGIGESVPLEINLIGMHVDEALIALDKYLDACRLKGYEKVRIIHGYGSGALREATRDYLKKHASLVKKVEFGGQFEGGSGATVVTLK